MPQGPFPLGPLLPASLGLEQGKEGKLGDKPDNLWVMQEEVGPWVLCQLLAWEKEHAEAGPKASTARSFCEWSQPPSSPRSPEAMAEAAGRVVIRTIIQFPISYHLLSSLQVLFLWWFLFLSPLYG